MGQPGYPDWLAPEGESYNKTSICGEILKYKNLRIFIHVLGGIPIFFVSQRLKNFILKFDKQIVSVWQQLIVY